MNMIGKLKQIAERARQDKKIKFTSLYHHINVESLAACYGELKKGKACGVDGVRVEAYGAKLGENLKDLVERLKTKRYQPQPVRRVYIPKPGKAELRPLGIPTVEDKLVQIGLKKLMEAIFEQDFLESSNGYRPNRSAQTAVNQLDKVVMTKGINHIVEVDIKRFFDEVQHETLMAAVAKRVSDPNVLWLIRRFLKAGIMEEGKYIDSEEGTPQGGVISPLLANIYLHYALDEWFEKEYKLRAKGYVQLIRYCDDFVVACQEKEDAEGFLKELEERLKGYGLRISPEKTKVVEFGRRLWKRSQGTGEKVPTIDFLGYTHYCTASRRGKFIVGHKTSKKRLASGLRGVKEWLKKVRNMFAMKEWWGTLKAKLRGHYNYFGISGNMRCLKQFYGRVKSMVFKWINRRSQKKSMNWPKYMQYLKWNPLPTPKIYHSIYTLSPIK